MYESVVEDEKPPNPPGLPNVPGLPPARGFPDLVERFMVPSKAFADNGTEASRARRNAANRVVNLRSYGGANLKMPLT